jgi:hypothetical protein
MFARYGSGGLERLGYERPEKTEMDILYTWNIAQRAAKESRPLFLRRQDTERLLYDQQFSQDFGLRLKGSSSGVPHKTDSTLRGTTGATQFLPGTTNMQRASEKNSALCCRLRLR